MMSPKRFFYIMVGAFSLSIIGGGAMLYFANNILKQRSSSVVDLKLESAEVEAQLAAYRAAKKDVEKYSFLNEIINGALPQDKDQARTVREIFLLAQQSGIAIKSVQFPSSTLGAVTSAPAASATATPTTTPSTTAAITQAKPVKGLNGVYSIETVITPFADEKNNKVTYDELITFLRKIESNRRAMQVASIQLNPLGQNATDSISFSLTLNIFIKP